MKLGRIDISKWSIGLPLLLSVFVPRSAVFRSPFLTYGTIGSVVGLAFLALSIQQRGIGRKVLVFWGWLSLISLLTACSQLLNASELVTSGISRIFRPLLYAVLVAYGYKVGIRERKEGIYVSLLWASYIIIAGQIIVGVTQLVGIDIFSFLYSSEKASPFYETLRITGTLANPNWLGWITLQVLGIIIIIGEGKYIYLKIATCFFIVLISGSRTSILIFPIVVLVAGLLSGRIVGNFKTSFLFISNVILVGWVLVFVLSNYFPYVSEISQIVLTGSFSAVHSLQARFIHWENISEVFFKGKWYIWAFGLSDRPNTQILDNDYLYVLFRNGFVGLFIHLFTILYILFFSFKYKYVETFQVCIVCVTSTIVMGLVAETLSGWFAPIWISYLLGLAVGQISNSDC